MASKVFLFWTEYLGVTHQLLIKRFLVHHRRLEAVIVCLNPNQPTVIIENHKGIGGRILNVDFVNRTEEHYT